MPSLYLLNFPTPCAIYSTPPRKFTGSTARGFGLPLARIYARYFGGELTLKSMEGYGVDAYLYLPMLGQACENLPERVRRSPGNLDSSAADVSDAVEGAGESGKVDRDLVDPNYGGNRHEDFWESGSGIEKDLTPKGTLDMLVQKALRR